MSWEPSMSSSTGRCKSLDGRTQDLPHGNFQDIPYFPLSPFCALYFCKFQLRWKSRKCCKTSVLTMPWLILTNVLAFCLGITLFMTNSAQVFQRSVHEAGKCGDTFTPEKSSPQKSAWVTAGEKFILWGTHWPAEYEELYLGEGKLAGLPKEQGADVNVLKLLLKKESCEKQQE